MKSGLPAVVHKMWPSATVNRKILVSVLKMLCTLTAQHPAGMQTCTCRGNNNNSFMNEKKLLLLNDPGGGQAVTVVLSYMWMPLGLTYMS